MTVLNKQQKNYDSFNSHSSWRCVAKEKFHNKKKIQEISGMLIVQRKEKLWIFLCVNIKIFNGIISLIPRPIWIPAVDRVSWIETSERTHVREPISPSERLALTLRYLASGESQQFLSFAFRISRTAISNILADTWKKILKTLSDTYFRSPSSEIDWSPSVMFFL